MCDLCINFGAVCRQWCWFNNMFCLRMTQIVFRAAEIFWLRSFAIFSAHYKPTPSHGDCHRRLQRNNDVPVCVEVCTDGSRYMSGSRRGLHIFKCPWNLLVFFGHNVHFTDKMTLRKIWTQHCIPRLIPVASQSQAYVSGRSFSGTVGSNPAGSMDVCLFGVLCDGLLVGQVNLPVTYLPFLVVESSRALDCRWYCYRRNRNRHIFKVVFVLFIGNQI
jgi:hypothetical protein